MHWVFCNGGDDLSSQLLGCKLQEQTFVIHAWQPGNLEVPGSPKTDY